MTILHRHGGRITAVTAIAHATERKVAHWYFVGNVEWDDGSKGNGHEISPVCLCHDGTVEGLHEVRLILDRLKFYLMREGRWHESRTAPDGRVYEWTPHKPIGCEELQR